MRRALLTTVVLLALVPAPVRAQDLAGAPSSTSSTAVPTNEIIPEPNSGRAPEDPGDPGGAAQLALLAAIAGGVTLIGVLAVRESRRARTRRPT